MIGAPKDDAMILAEAIRLVGEGVEVTFPVNGRSMRPFIEGGRDSVVLVRPTNVKPMDVVLAKTEDNRYVIHRVLEMAGERVTLMGDGNLQGRETSLCVLQLPSQAVNVWQRNDSETPSGGRSKIL